MRVRISGSGSDGNNGSGDRVDGECGGVCQAAVVSVRDMEGERWTQLDVCVDNKE